ncbi:DNA cytosine methyltransferase [Flavobacterium johnsoniae]|uniref:DNA cytosine methyltransferase n=1 Tax=Flavobacterium johnsoniae TaxID=986 RepID=UPI0015B9DD21|nr:DNA cytosine methyltransferase [Flavobacterium johnsoniae]NWL02884.1 DNA cytosine methyltransferase [Flavobacterium collinsii]WJS94476.1 DNA cytosine methyltransferase [Flavobacterium johnsoniae]
MKALNLYAGIGGNRKNWDDVSVTAVELDPALAALYSQNFPDDIVIVGDAHQYLLDHYKEFDFIWSSPPCQSHSSFRQNICVRFRGTPAVFPDMRLYQEILFLQHNAECLWAVENVKPYYTALIKPDAALQRHLFWSNFQIPELQIKTVIKIRHAQIPELEESLGFCLKGSNISNKRQVLRNCVDPNLGLHILNTARSLYMKNVKSKTRKNGKGVR